MRGFATSGAYAKQETVNLQIGQTVSIGNYLLTFHGLRTADTPGRVTLEGSLIVQTQSGSTLGVLDPNVEFFENGQSPTTNLGLYSTPLADLYVVMDGANFKSGESLFEIHLNPLVSLIWWGGYLYILGTFISLWPERRRAGSMAVRTDGAFVRDGLRRQLNAEIADLELDHAMGKISAHDYATTRQELITKLHDTVESTLTSSMRESAAVAVTRELHILLQGGEHGA